MNEIEQGFYSRINVLAYGIFQDPKDNSPSNPNNFLGIPTYQAVINPRVDLNLDFRRLELGVKPRFLYRWQRVDEGVLKGDEDNSAEFFVNEWIARYRLTNELFMSYGRENLQWGASKLLSSSNPFIQENGQNNPELEIPGLDYGRAVWIPNSTWSVSFIANTDEGRLGELKGFALNPGELTGREAEDFKRTYALKFDWTGYGKYFSVIPAYQEGSGYRVGFFGGWNVTDALLLYAEGAGGDYDDLELQGGVSYTFEAGRTVDLEYLHNENGCLLEPIEQCFLQGEVEPREPLFRRDYLFAQYTDIDIWNDLDVNLRLIHSLNDQSNRLIGVFDYAVGQHVQLFLIANGFMGSRDSEFGTLLTYSLFVGAEYTL